MKPRLVPLHVHGGNGLKTVGSRWRRPSTAVHDENVSKVRALPLERPRLSLRIVAAELVRRIHRIRSGYNDPNGWTNTFNALLR